MLSLHRWAPKWAHAAALGRNPHWRHQRDSHCKKHSICLTNSRPKYPNFAKFLNFLTFLKVTFPMSSGLPENRHHSPEENSDWKHWTREDGKCTNATYCAQFLLWLTAKFHKRCLQRWPGVGLIFLIYQWHMTSSWTSQLRFFQSLCCCSFSATKVVTVLVGDFNFSLVLV